MSAQSSGLQSRMILLLRVKHYFWLGTQMLTSWAAEIGIKVLTAYDLKAIPEIPNFHIRDYSTIPAVHQVHILVSKFLTKCFWLPELRLELFMDP